MTFIHRNDTLALIFRSYAGLNRQLQRNRQQADPVIEKIHASLPQSQCRQYGYPGCKSLC